eukprot:9489_1
MCQRGQLMKMIYLNGKQRLGGHQEHPMRMEYIFLSIQFPQDYPFKPPRIKFETNVYHCNINDKGGIDCAILKDNWSPALTISKVLQTLKRCFITGGNPDDPFVPQIAKLMKNDVPKFVQTAAEWNHKYAGGLGPLTTLNRNVNTYPNFEPWQRYCANK